jgi:hypothetical protein
LWHSDFLQESAATLGSFEASSKATDASDVRSQNDLVHSRGKDPTISVSSHQRKSLNQFTFDPDGATSCHRIMTKDLDVNPKPILNAAAAINA